jgi:hypothetical protein
VKQDRFQQALVGLLVLIGITAALLAGVILVLAEQAGIGFIQSPTTFYIPTLESTTPQTDTPAPQDTQAPDTDTPRPDTPEPDTPRPNTPEPDTPRPDTPTHTATTNASATPRPTRRPTKTAAPATSLTTPHTPTEALTEAFTSTPCYIPDGWVVYQVQPGDTIFLIGYRYGVRVDTMLKANCLSSSLIHAGTDVYVPSVTPRPVPTSLLTSAAAADNPADMAPTSTLTPTDGACTSPDSVIKAPHVGAYLQGTVKITGTARMQDFASFRLEFRQEGTPQTFTSFFTGYEPVINGTLAELDTMQWPNGEYWLRLVVVDSQNNYPERCSILIAFLNYK